MTVFDSFARIFSQLTPPNMSPIFFWGAFVVVYAISFSSLKKLNLFEDNTRLIMLVSFAISLMVAISPAVSQVLMTSLPSIGILIVFIVCALLATNILAPGWGFSGKGKNYVILSMFIVVGLIFMSGIFDENPVTLSNTHLDFFGMRVARADVEVVMAVLVIGIFIFLISGSLKRGGSKKE